MTDEPQDHRLNLPWVALEPQAIWTEPPIEGAAPLLVIASDNLIPSLSKYLVELHNAALQYRSHLPDASASADEYVARNGPLGHETFPESVRRIYVDGYGDGWRASTAIGQQEARDQAMRLTRTSEQVDAAEERAEAMAATIQQIQQERNEALAQVHATNARNEALLAQVKLLESERRDLADGWRASQANLRDSHRDHQRCATERAQWQEKYQRIVEDQRDRAMAYEDLLDDARIACSLSSSPGAREAAMARVRRISPSVQDQVEQFDRDVAENPMGETPTLPNPPDDDDDEAEEYRKDRPLRGTGHHVPSYAQGYQDGHNDAVQAFRDPMNQSGQALYAAHLLLAESVCAHEGTRGPWQQAVRRWQDEYVRVFGSEDAAG